METGQLGKANEADFWVHWNKRWVRVLRSLLYFSLGALAGALLFSNEFVPMAKERIAAADQRAEMCEEKFLQTTVLIEQTATQDPTGAAVGAVLGSALLGPAGGQLGAALLGQGGEQRMTVRWYLPVRVKPQAWRTNAGLTYAWIRDGKAEGPFTPEVITPEKK